MNIYDLYGDEIKRLTEEGKTTREIAALIGVGKSTIQAIIKKHGFIKAVVHLNEIQNEVLIGTIIGDGSIFKSTPNSNARINLAHSLKQKDYFNYKFSILESLIKTKPKQRSWIDKRTDKEYHEIKFQSRVNPFFTKLYDDWYESKKKIIKYQNIKNCGELCLSIKYFDDGYLNKNGNYLIAMNDYDENSISNFQKWLIQKFKVKSSLHHNKYVYIPSESRNLFKEIIEKYATNDVLYKI